MTSQSPPEGGALAPRDYVEAWMSIRTLVAQGASWSGREHNHVFLNMGEGRFADVSALSTADCVGDGRALGITDWDDDGRLDLVLKNRTAPRVQFFHNRARAGASFLSVRLRGVSCNRDAIGARVEVELDGRTLVKTLQAGDGYLAQSSKTLHFGLGDATAVQSLRVRWPDGSDDEHRGLEPNTRYAITQGEAEPVVVPPRKVDLASVAPAAPEVAKSPRARVPLAEKLPMAGVPLPSYADARRTVGDLKGRPTLLNLWSVDCAACMQELADFRARAEDLGRRSLRVVPLDTDGKDGRTRARATIAKQGFGDEAGYVDDTFRDVLEVLTAEVLEAADALPLPTSLLLDSSGQLVALYPGRLDVDELLADVDALQHMEPADTTDTRLLGGHLLLPRLRDLRVLARAFDERGHEELATYYRQASRARREARQGSGQ